MNISVKFAAVAFALCCITSVTIAKQKEVDSHSNNSSPNYEVVFAQDKVQRIDIKIDSEDWNRAKADLDESFGVSGQMMGGGLMGGGGRPEMMGGEGREMMPNRDSMMMGMRGGGRPEMMGGEGREMMPNRDSMMMGMRGGGRPEMMGGEGRENMDERGQMRNDPLSNFEFSPIWIPCNITYNGEEWAKVGFRFKGNSTLMRGHREGNGKLSIKLDFDEFEDQYPETKNQRFYGFKQLNLNSNAFDQSLLREKVMADQFRKFGVVAAQTAFYELYVDFGEGSQFFGLYTVVEEVDDTVIKSNFAQSGGNIYKPEERAGSFAYDTFNEEEFHLKSKGDESHSDVRALYDALHNPIRTTDVEAWKRGLEATFDVDGFLKWLAANSALQNWDTYGNMAHNYYLYNNPENQLLTWIPWDNNEGLQSGRNIWEVSAMGNVGSSWPLISYLIAVDSYEAKYKEYLREFIDEVFVVSDMQKLYDEYYRLLKPYAIREQSGYTYIYSESSFDNAVSQLKSQVESRTEVVNNYLK